MDSSIDKKTSSGEITKSVRIQTLVNRAKKLSRESMPSNSLEICLAFDTTGSMHPVFRAGQKAIQRIMNELKDTRINAKMAFIAYKNHGDEKYFDGEKPFTATPWTNEPAEIQAIMRQIPNAGGGDGLTALEDVLKYLAKDIIWDSHSAKAVVIVGDMPPHGVIDAISHCPNNVDYHEGVKHLKDSDVKVYTVYCDTDTHDLMGQDRKKKIQGFYHWIADETKGKCLSLEEIETLITILLGICMKETGHFDDFIANLARYKQLGAKEQKIIKALQ